MRKLLLTLQALLSLVIIHAQTTFHTTDINRFYQAFDSVQTTTNRARQIEFVQKIYINQGGRGMQYALENSVEGGKRATAAHWVDMMHNNKEKLVQIRPYFANLKQQKAILESKFAYFKAQYPEFKDGNVYFLMGLGMFAGRPVGNDLFIGCELVAKDQPDWAVSVVLHEFVHVLQKKSDNALLAHCLNEGAADFIAEVINQKSMVESYPDGYIAFGYRHEKAVWKAFKKFMPSNEKWKFFDWLYGMKGRNIDGVQMRDLGYFMGYVICKSYYNQATDKKQAIKDIIEMDVSSDEKAREFVLKSGYFQGKDLKFVKTFKFEKVYDLKKGQKVKEYGYKQTKSGIMFEFELPEQMPAEQVKSVTIAGTFNGWNPNDTNYKMASVNGRLYRFTAPRSVLSGTNHEFKFVINGEKWQDAPEYARNTHNGNLTITMR